MILFDIHLLIWYITSNDFIKVSNLWWYITSIDFMRINIYWFYRGIAKKKRNVHLEQTSSEPNWSFLCGILHNVCVTSLKEGLTNFLRFVNIKSIFDPEFPNSDFTECLSCATPTLQSFLILPVKIGSLEISIFSKTSLNIR